MKVYALFSGVYSNTTLHGVYSTREKAQEQIDLAIRLADSEQRHYRHAYYCDLADPDKFSGPRIEEWELDDEAYEFWTVERKEGHGK